MYQTICDVTSSHFLGRLVQFKEKKWDRGRWHPKGENSMAVCGFGYKNPSVGSLHKWSCMENSLLTSQGLHAVYLLARAG